MWQTLSEGGDDDDNIWPASIYYQSNFENDGYMYSCVHINMVPNRTWIRICGKVENVRKYQSACAWACVSLNIFTHMPSSAFTKLHFTYVRHTGFYIPLLLHVHAYIYKCKIEYMCWMHNSVRIYFWLVLI